MFAAKSELFATFVLVVEMLSEFELMAALKV